MITGIKIARGLIVRTEVGKARGFGTGFTVPVNESMAARAGVSFERRHDFSSSFKSGSEDVVFAYQLHKIRQKGKNDKAKATIGVFESKAAFLHGEEGEEPYIGAEAADIDLATVGDLVEGEDEDVDVETFEVMDDDGSKFVIVVPNDEF
ncbi:hypothetical protein V8C37DRAFT_385883 [Trichoderma ceciliae]